MSKKIKIAYLINDITLGGAQKMLLDLSSLLDKDKFDVKIFYLFTSGDKKDFSKDFKAAGINTECLSITKPFSLSSIDRLRKVLKPGGFDILHCHLPVSAILGTISGKLAGVKKIIIHEHNTHKFYSGKIRIMMKLLRPFMTLTICYSHTVEQELFGKSDVLFGPPDSLKSRSYTIFNGIRLDQIDAAGDVERKEKRRELGVDQNDIVIVCSARLVEWKGQRNLLQALAKVHKKNKNVKLLLVGGGEDEKYLKSMSKKLGLDDKVLFLGFRKDVYDILSVCDIYSSVFIGGINMSLSIATFEAMACRLPVIVNEFNEVDRFVKDKVSGIIVKSNDPDMLASAIGDLIISREQRQRLGINARIYVEENISWENLIKVYEDIYFKILK